MRINKEMQEFVIGLFKDRLPANYYYHDYEHTQYVIDKVIEIGEQENCTEKDIQLLMIAALWHDLGYINIYNGHEEESCVLARKYLPQYDLSQSDIDIICDLIMATKSHHHPKINWTKLLWMLTWNTWEPLMQSHLLIACLKNTRV